MEYPAHSQWCATKSERSTSSTHKALHKVAPKDAQFKTQKKIRVKLSGDGTNIGKHLHVINFTFTLLDEGSKAYSSDGNHVLAILREAESYDSGSKTFETMLRD